MSGRDRQTRYGGHRHPEKREHEKSPIAVQKKSSETLVLTGNWSQPSNYGPKGELVPCHNKHPQGDGRVEKVQKIEKNRQPSRQMNVLVEKWKPSIHISTQTTQTTCPATKDIAIQISEAVPLCCRRYFILNEHLNNSQTLVCQFKDYAFPWQNHHIEVIRRTIISFLNSFGGTIYIGVQEDADMRNIVRGRVFTEIDRQRVVSQVNSIQSMLSPQRETINRICTRFVPVKTSINKQFIPGNYIVKIRVASGHPQHTYFYEEEDVLHSYFRDEKSVRRIDVDQFWELQRSRFLHPVDRGITHHEGQCLQPEDGILFHGRQRPDQSCPSVRQLPPSEVQLAARGNNMLRLSNIRRGSKVEQP